MLELLQPLDYPRQSLYNLARGAGNAVLGRADGGDLARALPGAGGALLTALYGPLAGMGAATAMQGLGLTAAPDTFRAPTAADLVEGLGGDRDSLMQVLGAQLATDPWSYMGVGQGASMMRGRQPAAAAAVPEVYTPAAAGRGLRNNDVAPWRSGGGAGELRVEPSAMGAGMRGGSVGTDPMLSGKGYKPLMPNYGPDPTPPSSIEEQLAWQAADAERSVAAERAAGAADAPSGGWTPSGTSGMSPEDELRMILGVYDDMRIDGASAKEMGQARAWALDRVQRRPTRGLPPLRDDQAEWLGETAGVVYGGGTGHPLARDVYQGPDMGGLIEDLGFPQANWMEALRGPGAAEAAPGRAAGMFTRGFRRGDIEGSLASAASADQRAAALLENMRVAKGHGLSPSPVMEKLADTEASAMAANLKSHTMDGTGGVHDPYPLTGPPDQFWGPHNDEAISPVLRPLIDRPDGKRW
jgi:hypothetical protein